MMCSEGEKKCPLCAEEMDWTDQQLKPCKCGYEVCVWCWHHIIDIAEKDETEGRCPACRAPYDKEKIVGMEAQCERVIARKDREIKPQKPKPRKQEEKKDLSNVRVIQRKMAYVIGLPLSLADEDILQRKDYFGQYGKVTKISLSRTAGGAIQQFVNDSCSVYITYSKEEEAIRCIQSVHGFVLEGRSLRASFGTAKYCHAWLKNVLCNNPACLYLHSFGADEDSFGKDEEAAVHTRNRVHQIVGATYNMHWRSGTTLPPPLDVPLDSSAIATDKFISHNSKRELTSSEPLTSSMSFKDQDERIKTPNRSFVDVVARPSSGPEHGNVTEDQKLLSVCSNFSSIVIDESYPDTEHSNDMSSKVSSTCQSPIAVLDKDSSYGTANSFREPQCYHLPLPDKESEHHAADSFRDPSKYSVSSVTDFTKEQFCLTSDSSQNNLEENPLHFDDQVSVLASSYPVRYPDGSNCYAQQCIETSGAMDINSNCRNPNMFGNQVSEPLSVFNSSSANGFYESKIRSHPVSEKIRSNSFSGEEIVGQLRKLDDHNLTTNVDSFALEAVESNIVSSILSLDFDSCDDSMSLPHSLAERYVESDGRNGSLWNSSKTDNSRFSFTKEDSHAKESSGLSSSFSYVDQTSRNYSLFSDCMGNNFVKKDNVYSLGSQNNGLMTQSSAPPGFSVTPKDPPPGFSSFEMTNQLHRASSGNYLGNPVSYPNNQYSVMSNGHIRSASDFNYNNQQNPMSNGHARSASDFHFNNQQNPMSNGHARSVSDFDFNDPAILVVQGGKSMNGMNNLGLNSWQTSTTPHFTNSNPQYTNYDDEARHWHLMQQAGATQHGTNFASTFVQNRPSVHQEQKYSPTNGDSFSYMGNSFGVNSKIMTDQNQAYNPSSYSQFSQQKYGNGHVPNGVFSIQEVQRSDRLGFNNLYPGHRDLMYQMPNTGDVYNRVYGL